MGGVSFADEDILAFDSQTGSWTMFLDGSDIGLSGAGARDVDALTILEDGSVLISIVAGSTLPDVGAVDDSDIVRFVPTSTGADTAGSFEMYFDGSDVGLTTNGEDVDSVDVLVDGRLIVSTRGGVRVPGVSGADEDLLMFTPSSLGATTAGTWSMYFDGSDVALNSSSSEDLNGMAIDANGDLILTTVGAFASGTLTGTGADAFTCASPGTGASSTCDNLSVRFDGSANGLGSEVVDGLHLE